jgi:hypothetical protein
VNVKHVISQVRFQLKEAPVIWSFWTIVLWQDSLFLLVYGPFLLDDVSFLTEGEVLWLLACVRVLDETL